MRNAGLVSDIDEELDHTTTHRGSITWTASGSGSVGCVAASISGLTGSVASDMIVRVKAQR